MYYRLKITLLTIILTGLLPVEFVQAWTVTSGSKTDCEGVDASAVWDAALDTCTVVNAVVSKPSSIANNGTLIVTGVLSISTGKKLSVLGGFLDITPTAEIINAGNLTVTDTLTVVELKIQGTLRNDGTIDNRGNIEVFGTVVNNSIGIILNTNIFEIHAGGKLENFGGYTNSDGANFNDFGQVVNSGTSDNNAAIITNQTGSNVVVFAGASIENKSHAEIINSAATVQNNGEWLNQTNAKVDNINGGFIANNKGAKLRFIDNDTSFRNQASAIINGLDALLAVRDGASMTHAGNIILNKGRLAVLATGTTTFTAAGTVLQFCSGAINTKGGTLTNDGVVVNFGGKLPPAGIPGSGSVSDIPICVN